MLAASTGSHRAGAIGGGDTLQPQGNLKLVRSSLRAVTASLQGLSLEAGFMDSTLAEIEHALLERSRADPVLNVGMRER